MQKFPHETAPESGKNITHPTEAKLCYKSLQRLLIEAPKDGMEGNPYDGHTVAYTLDKIEKLTETKLKEIFVDRGYRGHDYKGEAEVH